MHELHLVGFTADHDGLIFSTKKGATSGAYVVGIDDALFSALEEARRMALADPDDVAARAAAERVRALRPTQHSSLSVREIQSRLRAGISLARVATEAGVDEAWVARFAPPVLAEQAAVVERAQAFSFTAARKGPSSRPLGEAVRWNLSDRGIAVDTSSEAPGWSAFQLEPGQWGLRFTYTSRGRNQVAEWEVDLDAGELAPRNRLASDLAFVEAGARRRKISEPPVAPVAAPPPPPRKATSGRKGTPARTTTARAQAAKATSKKAAAARAKATKAPPVPAPENRTSARVRTTSGRGASAAPAASNTAKATAGRPGAGAGGAGGKAMEPDKASSGGLARFPAPRPAAGRPGAAPAAPQRRPAPPAARQVRSEAPSPPPRPSPTPDAQPTIRKVAPPPPRRQPPTADARPTPAVAAVPPLARPSGERPERLPTVERTGFERPPAAEGAGPARAPSAEGPTFEGLRAEVAPGRSRPAGMAGTGSQRPGAEGGVRSAPGGATSPGADGVPGTGRAAAVRRLPSPTEVAASRRPQRQPAEAAGDPVSRPPTPEPPPEPPPPRPAPTLRPVGGGDGRPTILIIDAERAGDRRRS